MEPVVVPLVIVVAAVDVKIAQIQILLAMGLVAQVHALLIAVEIAL